MRRKTRVRGGIGGECTPSSYLYSQSKSKPSRLLSIKKRMTFRAAFCLFNSVDTRPDVL